MSEQKENTKKAVNVQSLNKDMQALREQIEAIKQENEELKKEKNQVSETSYVKSKKPKFLINKTVYIVPLSGGATYFSPSEDEATMHTGTSRSIVCNVDSNSGRLKKVLTDEEQDALENYMQIDLNPYKTEDNYFESKAARIVFNKDSKDLESATVELNLSDPIDYIKYKIALNHNKVAPSWNKRMNSMEYEYAVKESDEDISEEINYSKKEDFVFEKLLEKKDNYQFLENALRIYVTEHDKLKKIPQDASKDWIYSKLKEYTRNASTLTNLYNILNLEQADFHWKGMIYKAISKGLIQYSNTGYKTVHGELLGYTIDDVVNYLNSPKGGEIKLLLEKQLN